MIYIRSVQEYHLKSLNTSNKLISQPSYRNAPSPPIVSPCPQCMSLNFKYLNIPCFGFWSMSISWLRLTKNRSRAPLKRHAGNLHRRILARNSVDSNVLKNVLPLNRLRRKKSLSQQNKIKKRTQRNLFNDCTGMLREVRLSSPLRHKRNLR